MKVDREGKLASDEKMHQSKQVAPAQLGTSVLTLGVLVERAELLRIVIFSRCCADKKIEF
jgi:hypothetical protein